EATLSAASRGGQARPGEDAKSAADAAAALLQAQVFMSDISGPPESEDEQRRLTCTLHALEHASRLAETAGEDAALRTTDGGPDDARAAQLCEDAMRDAAAVAGEVAALSAAGSDAPSVGSRHKTTESSSVTLNSHTTSTEETLARLERCAKALAELRRTHRSTTLSAVATGTLTADEAIVRVDIVRRLEGLAHHAWLSAAQLV